MWKYNQVNSVSKKFYWVVPSFTEFCSIFQKGENKPKAKRSNRTNQSAAKRWRGRGHDDTKKNEEKNEIKRDEVKEEEDKKCKTKQKRSETRPRPEGGGVSHVRNDVDVDVDVVAMASMPCG